MGGDAEQTTVGSETDPVRAQWQRDCTQYDLLRREYAEAYRGAEKDYDKWLLTLSGGALGLSMAFLNDVVKATGGATTILPWCLFTSWVLFGACIVCVLANLRLSPDVHERFVEVLDAEFAPDRYKPDGYALRRVRCQQRTVVRLRIIGWLNWGSLIFFCAGVLVLGFFIQVNLH